MHWNRFLVGLNLALDALALSVQNDRLCLNLCTCGASLAGAADVYPSWPRELVKR